MTLTDEFGNVKVATAEQKAAAYNFEFFNQAHFPLFLGEILAIFEGNAGILNIYSQHSEPRQMFLNTIWTHITVGLMVISLCTVSYLSCCRAAMAHRLSRSGCPGREGPNTR